MKFPNLRSMDIEYFTFHRELEEHHEEEMANVLGEHINDRVAREKFTKGASGMLDSEKEFWEGLSVRA